MSAFDAPESAAGKTTSCPRCGALLKIPSGGDAEIVDEPIYDAEIEPASTPADATDQARDGERKPCPMCGEMIQQAAVKCRFCGSIFDPLLAKADRQQGHGPVPGESVEQAAKRLLAERHDRTTAIQLFVTSLIGCFSPILVIYAIVFLAHRPYPFRYKTLAIIGTVLHGIWSIIWILGFIGSQVQHH